MRTPRMRRMVKGRGGLGRWPSILLLGTVLSCTEEPGITAPEVDPSASLISIGASIIADAGGPYSGVVGAPITFTGRATVFPLGLGVTYTWHFGDGGTRTGSTVTYTYNTPGTYTVTLIVSALGVVSDSDTSTATIVPANEAPVADAGGPYSGTPGSPVIFDGNGSSDPDGDLPLSYAWIFGDGGTGTGVTPTHTYSTAGTYTVTLTVTDAKGKASAPATTTASIAAAPPPNHTPVADAGGPYSGTPGSPVTFDGNGSSDPDGDLPLSYAWTFGDGGTGTGVTPTHTYATAGTYTVTLTVTDAKGKTSAPNATSATISTSATRITGQGSTGTGPAVPFGSRRDFDFDATDAPGGRLFYRDWEVVRSDGTTGSLTVDPTRDPETGITFLARSSVDPACVEFGGMGRLDIGELHEFTVLACDYGSPGANLDTFRMSVPSRGYERGDRLSQGEITLSGS